MKAFYVMIICVLLSGTSSATAKPKVFVFTDINIGGGDPDDRQSLIHLLWYADELDILGIVPDRWNKQGLEACKMAVEAYKTDYQQFDLQQKQYPVPEKIFQLLAETYDDAKDKFINAALLSSEKDPLYVLVWGNMNNAGKILAQNPNLIKRIRLITIGTGLKYGPEDEVPGKECDVPNWNGPGRNEIYNDTRFREMWWLEINWTYNGMFSGNGPREMFEMLGEYGAMGNHIKFVTKDHAWAQYFRVGDTPSVLYVIDPRRSFDDPTQSSWAGKFKKPFPEERPNYYTDDNGSINWNYENPCLTWQNLVDIYSYNKSTLESERPGMYKALLEKLNKNFRKKK